MTLESNPFLNITGDTILNELEKIDELDLAKQLTALEFSLYTYFQLFNYSILFYIFV